MSHADRSFKVAGLLAAWLGVSIILVLVMDSILVVLPITAVLLALLYWYGRTLLHAWPRRAHARPEAAASSATEVDDVSVADHFIAREFAAAQRGRLLALVLFGFSRLDAFAQEHGQAAEDAAVRRFGDLLNGSTRRMNLSARYGWRGDTFMSVLSDADRAAAEAYVARIRESVEAMGSPLPQLAVGIAVHEPDMRSPQELVEAAERALATARAELHDPPTAARKRG